VRLIAAIVASVLLVVAAGQARKEWFDVAPAAVAAPTTTAAVTTSTSDPPSTSASTTTTFPEPHGDLEPGVVWDESAGALRQYLNAVLDHRYTDAYQWLCAETQSKVSEVEMEERLEAVPDELRAKAYRIVISSYDEGSEYAGHVVLALVHGPARHGSQLSFNFKLVGADHLQPASWRVCSAQGGEAEVVARVWPCSPGLACGPPITPTR